MGLFQQLGNTAANDVWEGGLAAATGGGAAADAADAAVNPWAADSDDSDDELALEDAARRRSAPGACLAAAAPCASVRMPACVFVCTAAAVMRARRPQPTLLPFLCACMHRGGPQRAPGPPRPSGRQGKAGGAGGAAQRARRPLPLAGCSLLLAGRLQRQCACPLMRAPTNQPTQLNSPPQTRWITAKYVGKSFLARPQGAAAAPQRLQQWLWEAVQLGDVRAGEGCCTLRAGGGGRRVQGRQAGGRAEHVQCLPQAVQPA